MVFYLTTSSTEHLFLNPFTLLCMHLNWPFKLLALGLQPCVFFLSLPGMDIQLAWLFVTTKRIHWTPLSLPLYKAVRALLWNILATQEKHCEAPGHVCCISLTNAGFLLPRRAMPFHSLAHRTRGSHLLTPLLFSFLIVVSLIGKKCYLIVSISMITNEFEHLFSLWAFGVSSFLSCLLMSFLHFSVGITLLFLLILRSSVNSQWFCHPMWWH